VCEDVLPGAVIVVGLAHDGNGGRGTPFLSAFLSAFTIDRLIKAGLLQIGDG